MKICFIAPGEIEIPPDGWGALETVLWNQYESLRKLGHDVYFINEKSTNLTHQKVLEINPDIVHLHYGKHWEMMPHLKCKKIITTHDGSFINSLPFHEKLIREFFYDCNFFCLTTFEENLLLKVGISPSKINILPNGVCFSKFNRVKKQYVENSEYSICLGKIDSRKRQAQLQSQTSMVKYVGSCFDSDFNKDDPNYLGAWESKKVKEDLTHYANLILLSSSELQPLVCLEAMSAGLGLVVTEACVQNLDTSKDFITVIPDDRINDIIYINDKIETNKHISLNQRDSIVSYAESFDWMNIARKFENLIQKIK